MQLKVLLTALLTFYMTTAVQVDILAQRDAVGSDRPIDNLEGAS